MNLLPQTTAHPTVVIATSTPAPALPTIGSGGIVEWGLLGTLVLLTFQKGWEVFSKKEESESALVKQLIEGIQGANNQKESSEAALVGKLIEGLRENQSQMLSQMLRTTERSHEDMKELKLAIVELNGSIRSQLKDTKEEFGEFRAALDRQNESINSLRLMLNQMRSGRHLQNPERK